MNFRSSSLEDFVQPVASVTRVEPRHGVHVLKAMCRLAIARINARHRDVWRQETEEKMVRQMCHGKRIAGKCEDGVGREPSFHRGLIRKRSCESTILHDRFLSCKCGKNQSP